MKPPIFRFELAASPLTGPHSGAAFDEPARLYRWARWYMWDAAKPYINFVTLNPLGQEEPALLDGLAVLMGIWERGRNRRHWKCGGLSVTSLFGRICDHRELRRLQATGVDIVGSKCTDAIACFAKGANMTVLAFDGMAGVSDERAGDVRKMLSSMGVMVCELGPDNFPRPV